MPSSLALEGPLARALFTLAVGLNLIVLTALTALTMLTALVDTRAGPTTTHFWGPVANWGFVVAGLADSQKPAERISPNMTAAMCIYSLLFMRFAWAIQPRNYILFACHASNEAVQLNQMRRFVEWRNSDEGVKAVEHAAASGGIKATGGGPQQRQGFAASAVDAPRT